MEALAPQLPGLEDVSDAAEPLLGECPACGHEVLAVEDEDGRELVAEPAEIMPEHDCPLCAQVLAMGHERAPGCVRCAGSRVIGEPYPLRGVAVAPDGRGRMYRGIICEGEALHALHSCPCERGTAPL